MGGFEHKTIFNEDMIMASKMIEDGKAVAIRQMQGYGIGMITRR